jgi:hypothetical protein
MSINEKRDMDVQRQSWYFIRELNADLYYQSYVLLVKIYMSLCQITKSVEVDSATAVQSMVKYIEIANVFGVMAEMKDQYLEPSACLKDLKFDSERPQ